MTFSKVDMRRGVTLLIAFALAIAAVVVPRSYAEAAEPGVDYKVTSWEGGKGYEVVFANSSATRQAWLYKMNSRAGAAYTYCVDYTVRNPGSGAGPYRVVDANQLPIEVTSSPKFRKAVRWIAGNGFVLSDASYGSTEASAAEVARRYNIPGLTVAEAITGTQAAIWYYAGGVSFSYVNGLSAAENARIKKLYDKLVNQAATVSSVEYPLGIDPEEKQGEAGTDIGPFTVTAVAGDGEITLNGPNALLLVNNTTGVTTPVGVPVSVANGDELVVRVPQGTNPGNASMVLTGTVQETTTSWMTGSRRMGNGKIREFQSMVTTKKEKEKKGTARATVSWTEGVTPKTPEIGTKATDKADGDKEITPGANARVVDTVTYSGLTAGETYTISGELKDKSNQRTVATASKTFVADGESGEETLDFVVPSNIADKTLVVFERLYEGTNDSGRAIATHEDLNDDKQTVRVTEKPKTPAIGTKATDKADGDQVVTEGNDATVVDTVAYSGLKSGRTYTLSGELKDKSNQRTVATASKTFVAADESGEAEVEFDVPSGMVGKTLVVFEKLYEGSSASGRAIAQHVDINDDKQTVRVTEKPKTPVIGTEATDKADGDHQVTEGDDATVVDTVSYSGLDAGQRYTLSGELKDKSNQRTVATASKTFVAAGESGEETLEFDIPAGMVGKTLVVFEKLYTGNRAAGSPIATHTDINDDQQTVTVVRKPREKTPKIKTRTADVKDDSVKPVIPAEGGPFVDIVTLTDLKPGQQYTLHSWLFDKTTNKPAGIIAENQTFTATGTSKELRVPFTIPENKDGHTFVVFDKLYKGPRVTGDRDYVAIHRDKNDAAQTVTVQERPEAPRIGTSAKDKKDNDKTISDDGGVIVDTVEYFNLKKGKTYTLVGWLMERDGSATSVRKQKTFEASAANGSVDVEFPVSGDMAGKTLVVFEELYEGNDASGAAIADHKDLTDTKQTVTVENKPAKPSIGTVAKDKADKDKVISRQGGTIVDTVAYAGLKPGQQYTLAGVLMDKAANKAVSEKVTKTFTASSNGAGTVEMDLPVSYEQAGKTLVVFEELYQGDSATGKIVADHKDLNDSKQTVTVERPVTPTVRTKATNDETGSQVLPATGGTVKDVVILENLVIGKKYAVTGELMDKSTGRSTGITAQSEPFVPTATTHVLTVTYTVPKGYAGKDLVVYETLHADSASGKVLARHHDINDKAQAVSVEKPAKPSLETHATPDENGRSMIPATGGKLKDVVVYKNLDTSKKYVITGVVMDKATGKSTGITAKSAPFTPSDTSGVQVVKYDIPASLAGKTLVVFEKLHEGSASGTVVASHEDINDASQTVSVERPRKPQTPKLKTSATDEADGDQIVPAEGGTIVDTVSFSGLTVGQTYVITGMLMDKANGKSTGVTATSDAFTPKSSSGIIRVKFTVPGTLAGKKLVVFEKLHEGSASGKVVAKHEDINDRAQTVRVERPVKPGVPFLRTSAAAENGDKNLDSNGGVVVDTVTYKNLTVGKTYVITGVLMEKKEDGTGEATAVTATSEPFTPSAKNGTVKVTFKVPAGFAGKTLVVFEKLHEGSATGKVVASHEDIDDSAQTVIVGRPPTPKIGTQAVDAVDGDQVISAEGGTVKDIVSFTNLVVGETYVITGELMDKETGRPTGITAASEPFTPATPSGQVVVIFKVPGTFAGQELVAFEKLRELTATGKVIASHEDIKDKAQTVRVERPNVWIRTTATDNVDGDKIIPEEGGTIKDRVFFSGLTVGKFYTISGVMMDKATGKATDITGSATFEAQSEEGFVDITMKVPAGLGGKTLVAFEALHEGKSSQGKVIARHEDINDRAQTVRVSRPKGAAPWIETFASDKIDADQIVAADGGTVVDRVVYSGLTIGESYTITGVMMDKDTGEATDITGSATFTAESVDGFVDVEMTVPAGYGGKTLVAFEKLHEGSSPSGKVIASHEDLADSAQTITVERPSGPTPSIGTVAADDKDGDKVIGPEGGTVVDHVRYTGLTVGTTYTVTGVLMDKETGESTGASGTTTFTATTSSGTVDVKIPVSGSLAGKTLVAFEKLYEGPDSSGSVVARHEDINDAAQTVTVAKGRNQTKPTPPGFDIPGGSSMILPAAVGVLVLGGAAAVAAMNIPQQNAEVKAVPAPVIIHKRQGVLAVTGADVVATSLLGLVLIMLAGGLLIVRRRRSS